jgi:WD40 repeat protein
LWWYARAWQLDGDDDPARTRNHRLRIALTLNEGPRLVGACFHGQPVLDAQFGKDARTILTRTDGPLVHLWDPFTSQPAAPPLAHDGTVHAAMFSPGRLKVITGSADGNLRLWDASTGKLLHQLPQDSAVVAVACDPLGQTVAAASKTGVVQFWSLETGEAVGKSLLLPAPAYHVAFSSDGTKLLTADVKDLARVWSVATGEAVGRPLPHSDHRHHSEHAIEIRCWPVFSPDGATVATVTNRKGTSATQVTLWDLEKGVPRFPAIQLDYFVYQVRFLSNGSRFTTANGDITQVRESSTGRELKTLKHPRESPHGCLSHDDLRMATCSTGGAVHLWDIALGKEKAASQLHETLRCADGVHALQFSPDSRLLLVASHDGTARVWEIQPGRPATPYQHDCGRGHLELARTGGGFEAFSPDGKRKLLLRRAASPVLSDANRATTTPLELAPPLVNARFSTDGKRLVGLDSQRTLRSWDAATGKQLGEAVLGSLPIEHLELSRDGTRILTVERGTGNAAAKRVVAVWDADTGKAVFGPRDTWDSGPQIFDRQEFSGRITRAALAPDGDRLATGSNASGVLAVWDLKSNTEIARRRVFHGHLQALRFSDDGTQLVTCSSDTYARVLHSTDLKPAGPSLLHPVFCRDADLDPSGASVVTVDSKGTVRLWDSHSGDLLGRLKLSLTANRARFSGDGGRIVVSNGQQVFELPRFHAAPSILTPLLRLLTGREIDGDGNLRPVDGRVFLDQPAIHRDAWLAWRDVK